MGLGRVWFVATAFCLLGASSACDSAGGNDGMFGGDAGTTGTVDAPLVPAKRGGAPAAWMPAASEMVIFGGGNAFNDTWRYDLEARSWAQVPVN